MFEAGRILIGRALSGNVRNKRWGRMGLSDERDIREGKRFIF